VPGAGWLASLPLQAGSAVARRLRGPPVGLPRPTVSIGNLALGGRGKTPVTAGLALAALRAGWRPAVLSRGHGGRIRSRHDPEVLLARHDGAPWLQPVADRARRCGEEPAWLAAVCPGVPVGVHPRRDRAAAAVLAEHDVDLFFLDDGFQTAVSRDVDVVLLDPLRDPPYARRAAVREGARALGRAQVVALLGGARDDLPALTREPAGLFALRDGAAVDPRSLPPLVLAAAVGSPSSVWSLAARAGVRVRGRVPLLDHRPPGALRRRLLARSGAVLITEKDAVGWACSRPPAPLTVVLRQRIEGLDGLWRRVATALDSRR